MGLTRRQFVTRVGQIGGYGAAFSALGTLGLMPARGEQWKPIEAAPGIGKGTDVVVLGGGMAGLVAAYELGKLGFGVTVLEARQRPGGRVWTGRKGGKVEFNDGTVQTIGWADGNYQNMGAARIPSTHWTILRYCRELGIPLEIEVNTSRSCLLQSDGAVGGRAVTQRQVEGDTRGHVSELLAKCMEQGALDAEFNAVDKDRMLTFLRSYGDLDKANKFVGGSPILGRAGFKIPPGAGRQVGVVDDPLDMKTLLDENAWNALLFTDEWAQQATMMQAVGGNDRIPYAFAKAIKLGVIHYGAVVKSFKRTAKGVAVTYTEGGAEKQPDKGTDKQIVAAYCVVALPFEIVKKLDHDLAPATASVITGSTPAGSYKIAWEARRFWEQDFNIYGGLSFLAQGPSPVWYPSASLMAPTGVVVSGYMEEQNTAFGNLSMDDKFAASRASVEKLHPGCGKELTKPVYVGWRKMKWNEASWVRTWGGGRAGYNILIEPDGPYYFAGDGVSNVNAWMEGAALSSKRVVQMISDRLKSTVL